MTLSERRYYRIATSLSILLHAALLLYALPKLGWFGPVNQMEMISAGIVEINPGAPAKAQAVDSSAARPAVAPALQPKEKIVASRPKKVVPVEPKKQPPKEAEIIKNKESQKEAVTKERPVKPAEKLSDQKQVKPKEQPPKQAAAQPKETPKKQPEQNQNIKESSQRETKTTPKTETETVGQKTGKPDTQNAPKDENGKPEASGGKALVVQNLGSGENMIASGMDIEIYYPKNALNEGKEGNVKVRVLVKQDGNIESITPIQLSGDSRLDNKTFNHIKQNIKFKPYQQNYFVDIDINFSIENGAPIIDIKTIQAETRF